MKIEIPIEIIELENESYHLLVSCKVNQSHFGDLVIDTGASKTVLDRNFVPAYELLGEQTSEMQSRGLGEGSLNTEMVKIDSFQLGGLQLRDFHCALIDLSGINEMYKEHCQREICGLLGSDFLVKHQAIINYKSEILQLEIL
ncbi:retropepsin-like aspartic protease [Labilibaculum sp.]|uniref:retropepsin-like aspartic protease n=1 Tax=Labilibaculum sp. TaxID=2060723 RepID=UPI003564B8F3